MSMTVRILKGAEGTYACIKKLRDWGTEVALDVRVEFGVPTAQSLRETAEKWREQAERLQRRAALVDEAADQLDADAERACVA